jgi:hypothetical protein
MSPEHKHDRPPGARDGKHGHDYFKTVSATQSALGKRAGTVAATVARAVRFPFWLPTSFGGDCNVLAGMSGM